MTGSQGHSSTIFGEDRGSGAIFEAARILAAFHRELREPYLTYNPSVMAGGTDVKYDGATFTATATGKTNVVPRAVVVEGDMRFLSREQLDRAREKMRRDRRRQPAADLRHHQVRGRHAVDDPDGGQPGAARDAGPGVARRRDRARSRRTIRPQRGAGDVSFVATLVSGLDGLGARGAKEHAPGEYADLDEIRPSPGAPRC